MSAAAVKNFSIFVWSYSPLTHYCHPINCDVGDSIPVDARVHFGLPVSELNRQARCMQTKISKRKKQRVQEKKLISCTF